MVKICCIESVDEAWVAVRHGASALGLVSKMPSGPGVIEDEVIRRIAATVPPGVATFLLTSSQDPQVIVEQQRTVRPTTLQLVDRLPAGAHAYLREELPGVALVQVIHVTGPESVDEALEAAGVADALLLDSGRPGAPVKELGGTGRTHDWEVSRRICDLVAVPVYLAGGLDPGNAAAAARAVRPFGLDACSGLRTAGRLDPVKVAAFMRALGHGNAVRGVGEAPRE